MSHTDDAEILWSNEGGHDVSLLVRTLADVHGATSGHNLPRGGTRLAINDLTEDARDLLEPVTDWEGAARAAGWTYEVARFTGASWFKHPDRDYTDYEGWQDLCENEGIDAVPLAVVEHWLVSDWLADRLTEKGEKVVKGFAGLPVWAKTSEGPIFEHPAIIEIASRYEPAADRGVTIPVPGIR